MADIANKTIPLFASATAVTATKRTVQLVSVTVGIVIRLIVMIRTALGDIVVGAAKEWTADATSVKTAFARTKPSVTAPAVTVASAI